MMKKIPTKFYEYTAKTLLVIMIPLAILAFWLNTNTNPNKAKKVLMINGFTAINCTGYKWFACSESDWSHTGFTALSPTKDNVTGTVCCGLIFKNCTIRFSYKDL